jgi:hypothetical protein
MQFIKGYKYSNEYQAIDSQNQCGYYYNVPNNINDITQRWVEYKFAELNIPQFYYIIYDDTLLPVLGEPTEFEVIIPEKI